jgi:hypothetical protein
LAEPAPFYSFSYFVVFLTIFSPADEPIFAFSIDRERRLWLSDGRTSNAMPGDLHPWMKIAGAVIGQFGQQG